MTEREKWFTDRIGKRVFRNKTSCKCEACADVYKNGLVIGDEMHADYLRMCEAEYTIEGNPLQYFDTKEEVIKFEKNGKLQAKTNRPKGGPTDRHRPNGK